MLLRVRFFKKIQDWILKSERIRKGILRFFITQINPRSPGSRCIKETKESISRVDSSVPLRSERSWIDPYNKETQNPFSDSFGFKNPILDFLLKKRTQNHFFQFLSIIYCHNTCKEKDICSFLNNIISMSFYYSLVQFQET